MPKKNPTKKPPASAKPRIASAGSTPNRSDPRDVRPDEPVTQHMREGSPASTENTKESQLLFPKKEEPKLLPESDNLDAFVVVDHAPDQTGHVDLWAGDLVGRRLSVTGTLAVSGWAIDEVAGLPVKAVFVVRKGKIIAEAPVDLSRPDVAAAKSIEAYRDSGWSISVSGQILGVGEHELEMYALMQDQSSVVRLGSRTVSVCPLVHCYPINRVSLEKILAKRMLREYDRQKGASSADARQWPKMSVDEVALQDGELRIRGWALSPVGISRVKVYLDGKFVGACLYGESRPDVVRSWPYVQEAGHSGFSMLKAVDLPTDRLTVCVKVIALDQDAGSQEFEKELPKDDSAAVELLRQASEKGDSWAEYNLGNMYRDGKGVAQNFEEALAWYEKGSKRGNLSCQNEIAWMILRGQGAAQDTHDAVMRFLNLAEQNYEWAQVALGIIYRDGIGTRMDSLEAARWFRMAADQGNQNAEAALREMGVFAK